MDRLSQMLGMQRDLQVNAYGQDPAQLSTELKIQFLKDMKLALESELQELIDETDWKPWVQGERKINYDGAKKELVDVWHFFLNHMLVLNMSTDELYKMYMKKRQVNANRQANGYDGKSTKCPSCKRAFEDVSLREVKLDVGVVILCQCGAEVPLDLARPFLVD